MNTEISMWQETLRGASLKDVISWAIGQWGDSFVTASSFGVEDMVLLHQAHAMGLSLSVFSLDTDLLFAETYALMQQAGDYYGHTFSTYGSRLTLDDQAHQYGEALWQSAPDKCCNLRKVEPLARALSGRKAWMTGMRREQSPTRRHIEVVEWDRTFNLVKINPLAHWSLDAVWDYVKTHDVLYNPLHSKGYPSIGCWPCTRQIKPGEDIRAGRWDRFEKKECGIHR